MGEYSYRDVVKEDGIPAIVQKELFERVQERLAKNKKAPARHKADDDYLLTTKLYCGKCGSFMVGESGTSYTMNVHRYYRCVNTKKKKLCDKKAVKKDVHQAKTGQLEETKSQLELVFCRKKCTSPCLQENR